MNKCKCKDIVPYFPDSFKVGEIYGYHFQHNMRSSDVYYRDGFAKHISSYTFDRYFEVLNFKKCICTMLPKGVFYTRAYRLLRIYKYVDNGQAWLILGGQSKNLFTEVEFNQYFKEYER